MEKLMDSKVVADILGIHHDNVRRLARTGELKGYRIGNSGVWRFTEGQVQGYLDSIQYIPVPKDDTEEIKVYEYITPIVKAPEPITETMNIPTKIKGTRINKPKQMAGDHCVVISEQDFENIIVPMRSEVPPVSYGKITEHLNTQWCNDDRTIFNDKTVGIRGKKIMDKLEDKQ